MEILLFLTQDVCIVRSTMIQKDTRVSMDIRIIMESAFSNYSREYKTTGRKKMPFLPGHYFSEKAV